MAALERAIKSSPSIVVGGLRVFRTEELNDSLLLC